jgi:hypothetical protein
MREWRGLPSPAAPSPKGCGEAKCSSSACMRAPLVPGGLRNCTYTAQD